MHTMNSMHAALSPARLDPLEGTRILRVGIGDVAIALITFVASFGVFRLGMDCGAAVWVALLLHFSVVLVPAGFLALRQRRGADVTIPALLLIATFAGGPIGAAGCAFAALALWCRRPTPLRLLDWYDYIAGIVGRSQIERIYDELASGRLLPDRRASVPRFTPILTGTSVDEQQRVLGVIGRRYHSDFRRAMRLALRNRHGLIRTLAAAIASRLDLAEKSRLWTPDPAGGTVPRDADAAEKAGAVQATR